MQAATRLPIQPPALQSPPPAERRLKMIFHRHDFEDRHTFVLFFRPSQIALAQQALGNWATDQRNPFSWRDATYIANALRDFEAQHAVNESKES